jgi:hypothetical protein
MPLSNSPEGCQAVCVTVQGTVRLGSPWLWGPRGLDSVVTPFPATLPKTQTPPLLCSALPVPVKDHFLSPQRAQHLLFREIQT